MTRESETARGLLRCTGRVRYSAAAHPGKSLTSHAPGRMNQDVNQTRNVPDRSAVLSWSRTRSTVPDRSAAVLLWSRTRCYVEVRIE